MKTSQRGLDLIKEFEGLYLQAYRCPAGVLTIGYGHTSVAGEPKVVAGMKITKQEAEDILRRDLAAVEADVGRLVKVPLTQNQFDALVSFQFNTGGLGRSSALKRLNAGNYADVPAALLLWNKAAGKVLAGLTRRRKAEAALFVSKIKGGLVPPPPDVEPVPLATKPAVKSKTIWATLAAGATTAGSTLLEAAGDWRIWAAIIVILLLAYIAWERNGKPDIRGLFK